MNDVLQAVLGWAGDNLLQLVLSAAAGFLMPVAKRYAALLKDESLRRVAQAAILEVEERSAKHRAAPTPGPRKLDTAIAHVLDRVPGIDREEADRIIHQELPRVRAATADFGKATLRAAVIASPMPPQ